MFRPGSDVGPTVPERTSIWWDSFPSFLPPAYIHIDSILYIYKHILRFCHQKSYHSPKNKNDTTTTIIWLRQKIQKGSSVSGIVVDRPTDRPNEWTNDTHRRKEVIENLYIYIYIYIYSILSVRLYTGCFVRAVLDGKGLVYTSGITDGIMWGPHSF